MAARRAYRLIAENTVEERILELQQHKREHAEAIVSAKNSVVRDLTAEDLALLLSEGSKMAAN